MLEPAQLIAPEGEIEPAMFPGDKAEALESRVQAYLTHGYEKATAAEVLDADRDDAARAWAYHRAFRSVFVRLSASPASVSLDAQCSTSRTAQQIAEFGRLAAQYEAEYLGLVPVAQTPKPAPTSGAVRTVISW